MRSRRQLHAALVCLALLAPAACAAPADYALDPVHTRVVFAVRHAGFSDAIGTISGSTGSLRFDPDDLAATQVRVEVPLLRLDLGDEAWNRATLARRLLDGHEHPLARFTSIRVEPVAPDRARLTGMLELRGVSREVVLDVVVNAHKRHPMPPFRRTVGFSATGVLSRAGFGMTAWDSMIGDAVHLRIEGEATRERGDGDGDDGDGPEAGGDPGAGTGGAGAATGAAGNDAAGHGEEAGSDAAASGAPDVDPEPPR